MATISLTDGRVERERIAELESALRYVIRTWNYPGPMGTMMERARPISEAARVLDVPVQPS